MSASLQPSRQLVNYLPGDDPTCEASRLGENLIICRSAVSTACSAITIMNSQNVMVMFRGDCALRRDAGIALFVWLNIVQSIVDIEGETIRGSV